MNEDDRFRRMEEHLSHMKMLYQTKLLNYVEDAQRFKLHQAIRDIEEQIQVMRGEIENGTATIW